MNSISMHRNDAVPQSSQRRQCSGLGLMCRRPRRRTAASGSWSWRGRNSTPHASASGRAGEADGAEEIAALVCRRAEEAGRAEPRRVINATGVVIHTNLGRAPLSRAAIAGR